LSGALQELSVKAHGQAVTPISSRDVSRALSGIPSFQGRSTG
jgi:hypothetical protein